MAIRKFFKIIEPKRDLFTAIDNQDIAGNLGMYGNYTWYHRLVQGSASRMVRYREYDLMDNDVDIARALDLIAEETAGNQAKTENPLVIQLTASHEQEVSSSVVVTLNAALKTWCNIQDWQNRLFPTIRRTIHYGDAFFIRPNKKFDKFLFVHPKNVVGAIVLEDDTTKVVGWHIKTDFKKTQNIPGLSRETSFTGSNDPHAYNVANFSAEDVIRFTLNTDMSDEAPFGESILKSVYKTFKQKELLEDALIIYRIQRAPERRVFKIEVGSMPPAKVAAHLEQVKNEFRQKRVPTPYGGQDRIESIYNPQCLDLNTMIPLLDGRDLTLNELISEFSDGKENWTYSINPDNGEIVPGKIDWAGITRKNTEVIKVTLDDGSEFIMTPDHKIPVQGKGYIEASMLSENDSLFSFNTKLELIDKNKKNRTEYPMVYDHSKKKYIFNHRMVANYFKNIGESAEMVFNTSFVNLEKNTIHHKDFNRMNANPSNLVFMNSADHIQFHSSHNKLMHENGLLDNSGFRNKSLRISDELFEYVKSVYVNNPYFKKWDLKDKLESDDKFMELFAKCNSYDDPNSYENKINLDKLSDKAFERIFKNKGYLGFRDFRNKMSSVNKEDISNIKPEYINLVNLLIKLIKEHNAPQGRTLAKIINTDTNIRDSFIKEYKKVFSTHNDVGTKDIHVSLLNRTAEKLGYNNFKHFTTNIGLFNHKIIKIEKLSNRDVGTLTIDGHEKYHAFHNFPIKSMISGSGIFVKNSQNEDFFVPKRKGEGTEIEVLPAGMNLGQLEDLDYFFKKIWRGMRIPQSYMDNSAEGGSTFNDGKVGIAYMQEILFTLYIERLQKHIEITLDKEFKKFLFDQNIKIDPTIFKVILPPPTNFSKSREQAMEADLINNYNAVAENPAISPRYAQLKYLKLTKEEFIINQRMRLEEKGINPDTATKADIIRLYSPEEAELGGHDGGLPSGGAGGDDFLNQPMNDENSVTGEEEGLKGDENDKSEPKNNKPQEKQTQK